MANLSYLCTLMKKTVIALYIVVVAVMAIATIVEKYQGTGYVSDHIYGAWWFSALWALLTAVAVVYFVKQRVRKVFVVVLHLSFVVILAGALLTHLTARRGIIHLRTGVPVNEYIDEDMHMQPLPFTVTLRNFEVKYHEGTKAAADYVSHIEIREEGTREQERGKREQERGSRNGETFVVSMNNIASYNGYRLYQSSFDEDMQGSLLAMNSDPWGIPLTYTGYALLFVSLVWMLIDLHGQFRQLLRRAATLCAISFLGLGYATASTPSGITATAPPRALPQETAERFGYLYIVYNDRVCPIETYALDFTKKLYGKRSYDGYTACQVLTGFIFFYDDWCKEPVIKVKGNDMKQRLGLPDYASFNSLFRQDGYVLGPHLGDKDVRKVDEKVSIIMELHQGRSLKIFPYAPTSFARFDLQVKERSYELRSLRPSGQRTLNSQLSTLTWYSPTDNLPDSMDQEHKKYMRDVFTRLNGEVQAGRYERANQYLDKMLKYQQTFGQRSIPSPTRTKAEHIYNKVPFATILFMVCLTLGILSFLLFVFRPASGLRKLLFLLLTACWLALTMGLALRWTITGTIPMSNGYETMLFLSWAVMLLALIVSRRFPIMLTFGFLLSGFFLLVSHISQMDPQMSHLMPVLNSPLLTLHVSIIMMAYALLSLTFISSLTALLLRRQRDQLTLLSQLMLYPALTCLGFGIFIGAIWANISWGTYWSWDPKETWALISFMVYAAPAHRLLRPSVTPAVPSASPVEPSRQSSHSSPVSSTIRFHVYMVLAFLTLLMTYFGVNYFLGGMHSYA